jgi:group I intron endonuclease
MSIKNRKAFPYLPCQTNEVGIYYILNTVNDKIYIGCTSDLRGRMRSHYRLLESRRHHSRTLQRDWSAYGETAFEFGVLASGGVGSLGYPAYLPSLEDLERVFITKVYQSHKLAFGYNTYDIKKPRRKREQSSL